MYWFKVLKMFTSILGGIDKKYVYHTGIYAVSLELVTDQLVNRLLLNVGIDE